MVPQALCIQFKFYVYTVLKMVSGRWRPLFSIHWVQGYRVISLRGVLHWPAQSPDLAPLRPFVMGVSKITCLQRSS